MDCNFNVFQNEKDPSMSGRCSFCDRYSLGTSDDCRGYPILVARELLQLRQSIEKSKKKVFYFILWRSNWFFRIGSFFRYLWRYVSRKKMHR